MAKVRAAQAVLELRGADRDRFIDELLALDRNVPSDEYEYVARLLDPRQRHSSPTERTDARERGDVETPSGAHAFLSYAAEDRSRVRKLHRRLRTDGHAPWLDVEDLLPGTEWESEIARALMQADIAILCLSNISIAKTGHVQEEIRQALELVRKRPLGSVFVIPARLEECDIPAPLRRYQWVDLYQRGGYGRLTETLRRLRRAR